jgi:protein phosphatase 1 regulatory subunit 37
LELGKLIQAEASPEHMEELFGLCDRLNILLARLPSTRQSKFQLQGLGLKINDTSFLDGNGANSNSYFANGNGHALRSESPDQDNGHEELPSPITPKVDKGKGRAEPEPEQHEPVLSPRHFLVGESEDEDEDGQRFLNPGEGDDSVASPTDR